MKVHNSKLSALRRLGDVRIWLALGTAALGMIVLGNIAGAAFPSSDAISNSQRQAPAPASLSPCVLGFTPPAHYPAGSSPVSVASGDFNADSNPDLVVANG